jgi:hypothetical protein
VTDLLILSFTSLGTSVYVMLMRCMVFQYNSRVQDVKCLGTELVRETINILLYSVHVYHVVKYLIHCVFLSYTVCVMYCIIYFLLLVLAENYCHQLKILVIKSSGSQSVFCGSQGICNPRASVDTFL